MKKHDSYCTCTRCQVIDHLSTMGGRQQVVWFTIIVGSIAWFVGAALICALAEIYGRILFNVNPQTWDDEGPGPNYNPFAGGWPHWAILVPFAVILTVGPASVLIELGVRLLRKFVKTLFPRRRVARAQA